METTSNVYDDDDGDDDLCTFLTLMPNPLLTKAA